MGHGTQNATLAPIDMTDDTVLCRDRPTIGMIGVDVRAQDYASLNTEDSRETFHDAQESLHSGSSSLNTSPGIKGHAGPNTAISKKIGLALEETLDATPKLQGEISPPQIIRNSCSSLAFCLRQRWR